MKSYLNPQKEESTKNKILHACLTFIGGVASIILIGFIISSAIDRDEKYDMENPWYGSIWHSYSSSNASFDDKQFETLEECRAWANKLAQDKNLKEGEWDYSCGKNCSFSDQKVSGGKKVNTYECEEMTK